MPKTQHNNFYGILFMLLNAVFISILYATMKFLTVSLSPSQVVFFYKFIILVLILPWIFKDGLKFIRTDRFPLHMLRGFLSIGGSLCFMYALKSLDMVDATALGYLEQVLLVIIGIVYFKEQLTGSKIAGIVLSFIGAIIVVYPDIIRFEGGNYLPVLFQTKSFSNFNHYYIFVLLSVLFWASNCMVVKQLGKTEQTKTQMFYVMLFSSIFSYPIAFLDFTLMDNILQIKWISFSSMNLEIDHIKFFAILALCYFVHGIVIFKAYKYAEMSVVVPFDYTRLLFTGILGYLLFDKEPKGESYVGYILIAIAGILLVRSEARRKKKELAKQHLERMEEELGHA